MEISRIGERKLIEDIWKIIGERNEDEDAHFFDAGDRYLLFAMDTVNEGFHFEREWDPRHVGKFFVDINLSDVASKNGRPLEMMASFSFPKSLEEEWIENLVAGIKEELDRYGLKYSGGDLKEAKKISLTGLVIGEVRKGEEFRRNGARPGDFVYISSRIGRNERAIIEYYRGNRERYREILDIKPRLDILPSLKKYAITSCIDNSDGVYKSLDLISRLSGVKIAIENDISENSRNEEERVSIYKIGGDYELLFTTPNRLRGYPLIGRVYEGEGVVDLNGRLVGQEGYDHFVTDRRLIRTKVRR